MYRVNTGTSNEHVPMMEQTDEQQVPFSQSEIQGSLARVSQAYMNHYNNQLQTQNNKTIAVKNPKFSLYAPLRIIRFCLMLLAKLFRL
jgi:hypothetical protein